MILYLVVIYMRKEILNFINLFSNDKKVLYSALVEKKDLILRNYYIELDFKSENIDGREVYPKIFALLDGGVYFTPCKLENEKEDMLVSLTSYLDLFDKEHIPFNKGCFYVGLSFKRIDDKVYKELFPNIYPKFNEGEFKRTDDDLINAYSNFMIGGNGEYVLLLPRDVLLNNVYPLEIAFEILYKKDSITKSQFEALEEFSSRMGIKLNEVN